MQFMAENTNLSLNVASLTGNVSGRCLLPYGHPRSGRYLAALVCACWCAGGCSDLREVGSDLQLTARQFKDTAAEINQFTAEIRAEYRRNEQRFQRVQDHVESIVDGTRRIIESSQRLVIFFEGTLDQGADPEGADSPFHQFIRKNFEPQLNTLADLLVSAKAAVESWTRRKDDDPIGLMNERLDRIAAETMAAGAQLNELTKSSRAIVWILGVLSGIIAILAVFSNRKSPF